MRYKSYLITLLLSFTTMILVVSMVRYPQIAFEASLRGLQIWWEVVFPATLPFMILSELMLGFGVVHFIGVFLEPLMRPLFKVPGTGGFVMAMGFSSGYPVGPKLAARLREQKLVSRSEGERLLCFTSTSDPIFIFGAVAVGFFHDASLGISIAIANYTGAILIGVLLRFHDRHESVRSSVPEEPAPTLPIILRALQAMHRARLKDNRPLGKLMGDAVISTFQTLMVIGGFIMIFSVIIKFVSMGLLAEILAVPVALFLSFLHIPAQMSQGLIIGFFEVTQSMHHISELASSINMQTKIAVASGLIAWGGISVHAQVASIISTTDMRYKPYFIWKGLHALFSGIICFIIWSPLQPYVTLWSQSLPVLARQVPEGGAQYTLNTFQFLTPYTLIILAGLFLLGAVPYIVRKYLAKV
ncbi:sporulation integral membrane protein YlbJ [Ammoniphilus sp. YIM 78166]|uniref:sporulation integral membrane protein YlbJ n=1 Tax=Ammoniphilus sp. YIM 78166 TaxID=1644106 RepID=UPI0010700A85|nr:sporulation integral membrane protein YlbJ [Ammoniphilus sp. YIM 78166]